MEALLQCGHVTETILGVSFGHCLHCGTQVKIQAIECREWVVWCQDCKGWRKKWFGQDCVSAWAVRVAHQSDPAFLVLSQGFLVPHSVVVDYVVPPKVKDRMRELYGRGMRLWILDTDLLSERRHPTFKSVVVVPVDEEMIPF